MDSVDKTRTYSNNIKEIYDIMGIEAAREAIIREYTEVISGTSPVNYRHISLISDVMTNQGFLMSIDRYGINKSDKGPLTRSSFEETIDQLMKASSYAEVDNLNGVTANIMMGQMMPGGTGECSVLIDEDKIKQIEVIEEEKFDMKNLDFIDCFEGNFEPIL